MKKAVYLSLLLINLFMQAADIQQPLSEFSEDWSEIDPCEVFDCEEEIKKEEADFAEIEIRPSDISSWCNYLAKRNLIKAMVSTSQKQLLEAFDFTREYIACIALSPRKELFAVAKTDGNVEIYDFRSNLMLGRYWDKSKSRYLTFDKNSNKLFSFDQGNSIRAINIASKKVESFKVHKQDVIKGLIVNHDGTKLIVWSAQQIFLWDIESKKLNIIYPADIYQTEIHINEVKFNSDGNKIIITFVDNGIIIHDLESQEIVKLRSPDYTASAISQDGSKIAMSSRSYESNIIMIFDINLNKAIHQFEYSVDDNVKYMAISSNGDKLVTFLDINNQWTALLWDLTRDGKYFELPLTEEIRDCNIRLNHDASKLLFFCENGSNIQIFDINTKKRIFTKGKNKKQLAFNPYSLVATVSKNRIVKIYDLAEFKIKKLIKNSNFNIHQIRLLLELSKSFEESNLEQCRKIIRDKHSVFLTLPTAITKHLERIVK